MQTHLYPCSVIEVAECGPCTRPFTYGGAVILTEWDGQTAYVCPDCARRHGGRTGREHAEAAGHALRTVAAIEQQHARTARQRQAARSVTERQTFRPMTVVADARTGRYREVP